ncbi:MAG: SCO family protein [Nitrospirae bacterium]|nr:SCO family protein [Nitrospirota bacterium]
MKINEDDYLGKQAPDIVIVDDHGKSRKLSDYGNKPIIFSIIYYNCGESCPVLNEGLSEGLSGVSLNLGTDYNVITLSFDGKETTADAAGFRKRLEVKMKDQLPAHFDKWVFATTTDEDAKKLTGAIGYRYFYSRQDKVFVHPNVYIFLSPGLKVSRYIWGLYPISMDLKLAITEAAKGKIGKFPILSTVALACYKYDASIGGYRLNLTVVFGLMGMSFGLITGLIVFLYAMKLKKKRRADFQLSKN